jgi:hypothetical protein
MHETMDLALGEIRFGGAKVVLENGGSGDMYVQRKGNVTPSCVPARDAPVGSEDCLVAVATHILP